MLRTLGKFLQILGLIALPLAMVLELSGGLTRAFGVSDMVIMLIFGASVFYVGRFLEGYTAS